MAKQSTWPGFSLSNCAPNFYNVESPGSAGGLVTADIEPFDLEAFEDQEMQATGVSRLLAQAKMGRICGVRENSLYDLFMSRMKFGQKGLHADQNTGMPFVYEQRETIVNLNNFSATAGTNTQPTDVDEAWPSNAPVTAWYFTVAASTAGYGSAVQDPHRYFLPGNHVVVNTINYYASSVWKTYVGVGSYNGHLSVQYRVVAARKKTGSNTTCYLMLAPTDVDSMKDDAAAWAAYQVDSSTGSAPFPNAKADRTEVTVGNLIPLTNSTSNRESWCYQTPLIHNVGFREIWKQTHRWSFQYNDEWVKAISNPNLNDFWKTFRMQPLSKHRAANQANVEKFWLNTIFYGQPISDKQTIATWNQLPTVQDATNPGQTYEYKANALGIRYQLSQCGRVYDFNGAALSLTLLFPMLQTLKRNRDNSTVNTNSTLESLTDRTTKSNIFRVMTSYYKQRYGIDNVNVNMDPNQSIVDTNKRQKFEYDRYWLPDYGFEWVVIHHQYFDDAIAAFTPFNNYHASTPVATVSPARAIWFLDVSDIEIRMGNVRSIKRATDKADPLYMCVIDSDTNHVELNSAQFAVVLGDESRHLLVENFSSDCPVLADTDCNIS